MTLSNFDWTDKNSVKWFILRPQGHEGPYSLQALYDKQEEGALTFENRVWCEGLITSIKFEEVLKKVKEEAAIKKSEEEIPPLPPLPIDDFPPLPTEGEVSVASRTDLGPSDSESESYEEAVPKPDKARGMGALIGGLLLIVLFAGYQWIKAQEEFSIPRPAKMSPELHQRILRESQFQGWDNKIFFKEYVPDDLSRIWLITSGFQNCDVEASFKSVDGKLLNREEESVAFKGKTVLRGHIAEFSSLEFSSGNKVIPGLYEMDVRASNCTWDGLSAKLGNKFKSPEKEYSAKTKVILYSKGAVAFNQVLDKLLRNKMETDLKNQNQEDLFWQGLQEKFQTLLAVTLQVEHLFIDLLEKDPKQFSKNLKSTVDQYTKKYGRFLTEFVVSNEAYFKDLSESQLKDISKKRTYEMTVRLTSKRIGHESMRFIENFQSLKSPTSKDLNALLGRLKEVFKGLKSDINRKIIQISEDRSL